MLPSKLNIVVDFISPPPKKKTSVKFYKSLTFEFSPKNKIFYGLK